MCGRFIVYDDKDTLLRSVYSETHSLFPGVTLNRGEIFPSNTVAVIGKNDIKPFPAVWGYPGFNGKGVIINARAETATEKFTFRDSLLNRRCVIPASGYYEWSENKTKYEISLPGQRTVFLAGFYRQFDDFIRFVILTTSPNKSVTDIHNRMPFLLEDNIAKWINDTEWALYMMKSVMPGLVCREA